MITHIFGFSGSRHGMTRDQKRIVAALIKVFQPPEVHHGCCVGADEQFHLLVRKYAPHCIIVGHPPINTKLLSKVHCDVTLPPKDYLARNRDIVNASTLLIATPNSHQPTPHSGTWYTAHYAKDRALVLSPTGDWL